MFEKSRKAPDDFPAELRERAGSLAMSLGRPVDRVAFAVALLRAMDSTRAFMQRELPAIAGKSAEKSPTA